MNRLDCERSPTRGRGDYLTRASGFLIHVKIGRNYADGRRPMNARTTS
jgi:hypothetical protein